MTGDPKSLGQPTFAAEHLQRAEPDLLLSAWLKFPGNRLTAGQGPAPQQLVHVHERATVAVGIG